MHNPRTFLWDVFRDGIKVADFDFCRSVRGRREIKVTAWLRFVGDDRRFPLQASWFKDAWTEVKSADASWEERP